MSTLRNRFREHVSARRLFPRPGTAIVAVSGGPDSVSLLDLLHAVGGDWGLDLVVAHADHGIQLESANVGKAVGELAARYGLPLETAELRLGADASETTARRARYAWLADVRRRRRARYVVTAHHADDQIETVLLRVLRGSAPAGLAAMSPRARGGLVRPLLPFTKDELRAYAAARDLPVREDPANSDPRHLRSWVRTALLPAITARLGNRARGDLARVARAAAQERHAWNQALELVPELGVQFVDGGFDVVRAVLGGYDDALAVALLRTAARRAGLVLGPVRAQRLLALAAGTSGRRVELGQGWVGEAVFERLVVRRPGGLAPGPGPGAHEAPEPVVAAADQGQASFGSFTLQWRPEAAPPRGRIGRSDWTTWLAGHDWQVRGLEAGDTVRPLGGIGRRRVRRLLMEARVPRGERAAYPVVARGETILWVPGVCRSADELPAPGTQAVRVDVSGTAGA